MADGERLKPARPGMGIEGNWVWNSGIEPPVDRVGDEIKERGAENTGAEEQREAPAGRSAECKTEQKREGETKIPG